MARGVKAGSPVCPVFGCLVVPRGRKYCEKHYKRFWKYGDPLVQRYAPATPGMNPAVKKAWVEEYKLSKGCADCGYNDHPAALDFDHRPGTIKIRDIKCGQHLGWAALQAEVAKCDVVCANCHRVRTVERRKKPRRKLVRVREVMPT